MGGVEKICCYDRDNNDAPIAALANSKNNDPMTAVQRRTPRIVAAQTERDAHRRA